MEKKEVERSAVARAVETEASDKTVKNNGASSRTRLEVGRTYLPIGHSLGGPSSRLRTRPVPRSDMLSRLEAFLPKIRRANEDVRKSVTKSTEIGKSDPLVFDDSATVALEPETGDDGATPRTATAVTKKDDAVEIEVLVVKSDRVASDSPDADGNASHVESHTKMSERKKKRIVILESDEAEADAGNAS